MKRSPATLRRYAPSPRTASEMRNGCPAPAGGTAPSDGTARTPDRPAPCQRATLARCRRRSRRTDWTCAARAVRRRRSPARRRAPPAPHAPPLAPQLYADAGPRAHDQVERQRALKDARVWPRARRFHQRALDLRAGRRRRCATHGAGCAPPRAPDRSARRSPRYQVSRPRQSARRSACRRRSARRRPHAPHSTSTRAAASSTSPAPAASVSRRCSAGSSSAPTGAARPPWA